MLCCAPRTLGRCIYDFIFHPYECTRLLKHWSESSPWEIRQRKIGNLDKNNQEPLQGAVQPAVADRGQAGAHPHSLSRWARRQVGVAAPGSAEPQDPLLGAEAPCTRASLHPALGPAPSKCSQLGVFARSLWLCVLRGRGEWEIQKLCGCGEPSPTAGGSYQPLCLCLFTAHSRLWFF